MYEFLNTPFGLESLSCKQICSQHLRETCFMDIATGAVFAQASQRKWHQVSPH